MGGQDEQAIDCNEGKKILLVIAIERKGKGIARMYGRVIETASKKNLETFMKDQ